MEAAELNAASLNLHRRRYRKTELFHNLASDYDYEDSGEKRKRLRRDKKRNTKDYPRRHLSMLHAATNPMTEKKSLPSSQEDESMEGGLIEGCDEHKALLHLNGAAASNVDLGWPNPLLVSNGEISSKSEAEEVHYEPKNNGKRRGDGMAQTDEKCNQTDDASFSSSSSSSRFKSFQLSRWKSRKPKGKSRWLPRMQPCNATDPIMLTELSKYTFDFVRPNKTVTRYNIDSLVQYFLVTGEFSEPETRIPFSDEELQRLDQEAKRMGFQLGSVVEAKKNRKQYEEKRIQRDGVLGLERCMGDVVTEMMAAIETEDLEDAEMRLVMSIFPSFSDLWQQLHEADPCYARQCLSQFKEFVRGPPNRPTRNRYGLLTVVLDFLKEHGSNQHKHGSSESFEY